MTLSELWLAQLFAPSSSLHPFAAAAMPGHVVISILYFLLGIESTLSARPDCHARAQDGLLSVKEGENYVGCCFAMLSEGKDQKHKANAVCTAFFHLQTEIPNPTSSAEAIKACADVFKDPTKFQRYKDDPITAPADFEPKEVMRLKWWELGGHGGTEQAKVEKCKKFKTVANTFSQLAKANTLPHIRQTLGASQLTGSVTNVNTDWHMSVQRKGVVMSVWNLKVWDNTVALDP